MSLGRFYKIYARNAVLVFSETSKVKKFASYIIIITVKYFFLMYNNHFHHTYENLTQVPDTL